jgi:hypothetical protein
MPDLETILQDFASFIEDELPPPDVERLVSTAPVRPAKRFRWRPAVVFVVAAATVLLIGGVPLLVFGDFSSSPVYEEPVPTTSIPATTTTAAPTTTGVPDDLEAVPFPLATAEDAVAELHDAWNSGDAEYVLAVLGHPDVFGDTDRVRIAIATQNVGARLETDCGPGAPTASGTVEIVCTVTLLKDRFYTPAGVRWTRQVTYIVDERGISTDTEFFWTQGPSGEAREYLIAFDQWLFERYQNGQPLPGWIWVDPDNGLLPNRLDGNPCCLYSVENSAPPNRWSRSSMSSLPNLTIGGRCQFSA